MSAFCYHNKMMKFHNKMIKYLNKTTKYPDKMMKYHNKMIKYHNKSLYCLPVPRLDMKPRHCIALLLLCTGSALPLNTGEYWGLSIIKVLRHPYTVELESWLPETGTKNCQELATLRLGYLTFLMYNQVSCMH